ncbi:MAG: ABC transporter permease [Acidobacteriota bacterium]|nr:ABC transporter permease [Acidobacteriota bacterium]
MSAFLGSVQVALATLRLNPLRTMLSTLGIIMGAASLAAVLSLADGGERLAREAIERQGISSVHLRPETDRIVDGLRLPQTSFPIFSEAEADRLSAAVGDGVAVILSVEGTGTIDIAGQRTRAARVVGRYALKQKPLPASGSEMVSGRTLSEADMKAGAARAVISLNLSEELTRAGIPGGRAGEMLPLAGGAVEVIGVRAAEPGESVFTVIMPLARAEAAMAPAPVRRARTFTLLARDVDQTATVREAVERFAAAQPAWNGQFAVASYGRERLEQAARGILIFKMLMGAFTAISLVVGGIGIMNVLLASILERTREIGIRKAVGARRRDVLRQFLIEAMTISVAGTAAGVALGLTTAFIVTAVIRARTEAPLHAAITWQTLLVTAVAAISVGLAAGVYPALRASRLTAIDAIQRD